MFFVPGEGSRLKNEGRECGMPKPVERFFAGLVVKMVHFISTLYRGTFLKMNVNDL